MYINDKLGGVRLIRPGAGPNPSSASPLTMMGVGGCPMGDDWTTYGQATTSTSTPTATTTATTPEKAEPSAWDRLGGFLSKALTPQPTGVVTPVVAPVVAPGMSTTTKIALAGGALVLIALIARR